MMAGLKLEIFEPLRAPAEPDVVSQDDTVKEDRLEAYEQGYRAGWDDAAKAEAEDQRKIRMDLAHGLQSLNFTFHEARAHVLQSLAPLMQEMVSTLLPDLARQALAPLVADQVTRLAAELAEAPLVLAVHAQDHAAIQAQLERLGNLSVTLREEPSLAPGQVSLRRGSQELRVDLARCCRDIATATRGFFGIPEQE